MGKPGPIQEQSMEEILASIRRMISEGRVLEVAADIVIPADRAVLDYAIDLQAPAAPPG